MNIPEFHIPLRRTADSRSFRISRALLPFLVWLLAVTFNSAILRAQAPASSSRPATVPTGYVITPFGYFHPSCVKRLMKGDVLLKDNHSIKHEDGNLESIPTCAYARFNAKGEIVKETVSPSTSANGPTIGHSYIEDETVITSSSFGKLTASWSVPFAPTSNSGQTLYFFPGLEDHSNVVSIVQPVLGWNSDYPNAWGIASWNCCVTGTVYESSPVSVSPGDTIYGAIQSTCSPGTFSCSSWNITTEDLASGQSTTLSQSSADGQTFNWAFAGALEVYNVSSCSNYPPNGSTSFDSISLYDYNLNLISNPSWSLYTNTSVTPQCNYGGSETATNVMLSYGQAQPRWSGVGTNSNVCGRQNENFTADVYQSDPGSATWQVATAVGPGDVTSVRVSLTDAAGTFSTYGVSSNGGTFGVTRLPVSQPTANVAINFRDYYGTCSANVSFPLNH